MGKFHAVKTVSVVLAIVVAFRISGAVASSSEPHRSPYQADVALTKIYEVARSPGSGQEVELVPTVRIQGRVHGVGFVDARFDVRRNKTWASSMRSGGRERTDTLRPVLLQGRLAAGGAWKRSGKRIFPTAASIIGRQLKVTFPGRAKGSLATRQRVYTITMSLDGALIVKAHVSSIPRSVGRRGACGAAVGSGSQATVVEGGTAAEVRAQAAEGQGEVVPPLSSNDEAPSSTLQRVITISTDADQEWYQRYGEQSNAIIASYINTAEAIYNRQLGIRFRLVKQHVYADGSPYLSSDAGDLLTTFVRNPDNGTNLGEKAATFQDDIDLKHLFTGKDIDGSIIGIAYIGVVCAVPTLSYGVTQAYMEVANPAIFAHEVGHNFGASHDTSDRTGLMYPSISIPPADRFSDTSLGEITTHLSKYGSCISLEQMAPRPDATPGPDPVPTEAPPTAGSITIRKDRIGGASQPIVRISGKLLSGASQPMPTVGVRLMVSGEKVADGVTAADGSFEFYIRLNLPKGRQVYVYVETEGGEVFSNFLWMSSTAGRTNSSGRRGSRGRR